MWTQKLRSLNLDHLRDRQWQNMDVREDFEITALLRHGPPGAEIPVRHEIAHEGIRRTHFVRFGVPVAETLVAVKIKLITNIDADEPNLHRGLDTVGRRRDITADLHVEIEVREACREIV